MRSRIKLYVMITVGFIVFVIHGFSNAQVSKGRTALTIKIINAEIAKSFSARLSQGGAEDTDISEPSGGGMPLISLSSRGDGKATASFAGEINAPKGRKLLKVTCEIENTSDKSVSFRVGDMAILVDSKPRVGVLGAVGMGTSLHLKSSEAAREAVKKNTIQVDPQSTLTISYSFSLDEKWLSRPLALSLSGGTPVPLVPSKKDTSK